MKKLIHYYVYSTLLLPFILVFVKLVHNLISVLDIPNHFSWATLIGTSIFFLFIFQLRQKDLYLITRVVKNVDLRIYYLIIIACTMSSLTIISKFDSNNVIYISGDGISHVSVIRDIMTINQSILGFNYSTETGIGEGIFYPVLSHYLPAIFSEITQIDIISAYYISQIYLISFVFPLYLFFLLKNLTSSNLMSYYITIISLIATIFPLGLFYTANFAQLFANILLFYFLFLIKLFRETKILFFYLIILSFILTLAHPTSVFSFILVILILGLNKKTKFQRPPCA